MGKEGLLLELIVSCAVSEFPYVNVPEHLSNMFICPLVYFKSLAIIWHSCYFKIGNGKSHLSDDTLFHSPTLPRPEPVLNHSPPLTPTPLNLQVTPSPHPNWVNNT